MKTKVFHSGPQERETPAGRRSSLVVWVGVGAGAGLAVLRRPDGRVAEEAGRTLLAQLTLGVVQAALIGQINPFILHILPSARPVDSRLGRPTVQMPVSGWQESEWPLHSHSSQCPRYSPPPVRVYPGAQSWKRNHHDEEKILTRKGGA